MLWLARGRIANRVVADQLAKRSVPGIANVVSLSPARIVLDNVRLGRAARPDLVAARVEIALGWRGLTPHVVGARLGQAVLRVAIDRDGRVSVGSLDTLVPRTGKPLALPDLALDVVGGTLLAATPIGPLRLAVAGSGNPARRFSGTVDVAPATLALGPCRVARTGGRLTLATDARVLSITGRLSAPGNTCRGFAARGVRLDLDLRAAEPFVAARGTLRLALDDARGGGGSAAAASVVVDGRASAAGASGRAAVALDRPRHGDWSAARATIAGPIAYAHDRRELDASGRLTLHDAALAMTARAAIARPIGGLILTPLGPLEAALRTAAARGLQGFDLTARLAEASEGGVRYLSIATVDVAAASGLRATLSDGAIAVPLDAGGQVRAAGRLALAAPGVPAIVAEGDQRRGQVAIGPWRAGNARMAATTLSVTAHPDGIGIAGPLLLDGPLGPGRVEGLGIPAAGFVFGLQGGGFAVTPVGCFPVEARRIVQPRYTLVDAQLKLCRQASPALRITGSGALGGGFEARDLALGGTLADTRFALSTPRAMVALAGSAAAPVVRIVAAPVSGRMIAGGVRRPFTLERLTATATQAAGAGAGAGAGAWQFAGKVAGGAIGGFPAQITAFGGTWTMAADGALGLADGSGLVADRARPPRFQPLLLRDTALAYRDGMARGTAALVSAAAGVRVGALDGHYDFARATGALALRADLAFGPALQPFQLSERARGQVENVSGRVIATADLNWRDGALSGPGQLRFDDVALATAGLGTIAGITGTIALADAPGLVSPPGQQLVIGSVDPGVRLADGRLSIALTGGGRVRIESLDFPFAGGTLALDPVTLDVAVADRAFTMRVIGLDAARFVETLKFENYAMTGLFDGVLPIMLSQDGSRIVGGRLASRPPGGTLAYVGGVGDNLPGAARLAFDALKAMRYQSLTLGIDGDLDGELVTSLAFSGESQQPVRAGGMLPAFAPGVPFRFNVAITAPFRRLLGTAAGLSDARPLIDAARTSAERPPEAPPR